MDTRRKFLTGILVAGAAKGLRRSLQGDGISAAQAPGQPSGAPSATRDNRPQAAQDATADNPNLPSPEKRALEENEKEIKKKVERLYELATDLKAEADKTDTSKVFSATMVKKAEEIEKLAKDIRTRSKG